MQLKIRRSQRDAGVISNSVVFCLDARAEYSPEERASIQRYKLQRQIVYNSEAAKKHLSKADSHQDGSVMGSLKSLGATALAAMRLNISIGSLEKGHHIECKSLDELLGAEDAIMEACQNLRAYLDAASTFDGREVVIDFSGGTPKAVAQAIAPDPQLVSGAPLPPPLPSLPDMDPGSAASIGHEAPAQKTPHEYPTEYRDENAERPWWMVYVPYDWTEQNRNRTLAAAGVLLLVLLKACH